MNNKEFIAIIMFFIMVFIGISCMSTTYGANVDVISDFDNNTLTSVELSDSQSKTIWGFENLAEVQTRTGGAMKNTEIETDEGLWTYQYMILDGIIMDDNDRVYGKNGNQTLFAHYVLTPYGHASITIVDEVGNTGGYVDFPTMTKEGDSVTHTFKEPVDVDSIHYDFWYIVDETGSIYLQPGDNYTITYNDCVANNGTINKVFTYTYGYFPDYTVTYTSMFENGTVFDTRTDVMNRENWSSYYVLPDPELPNQLVDYIHIIEDNIDNYPVSSTYETMYDMALSEGNNLTRTFIYHMIEGSTVTFNYTVIDDVINQTIDGYIFEGLIPNEDVVGFILPEAFSHEGYIFDKIIAYENGNIIKQWIPDTNFEPGEMYLYDITEANNITIVFHYTYKVIEDNETIIPDRGNNNSSDIIPDILDNNTICTTSNTNDRVINMEAKQPVTMKETAINITGLIGVILLLLVCLIYNRRR